MLLIFPFTNMDDSPETICCVQVGNVEVEVQRKVHPDSEDGDRGWEDFSFAVGTPGHGCREYLDMEELPDLLQAVGQALRLVRARWHPHAASKVNLEKLFEVS